MAVEGEQVFADETVSREDVVLYPQVEDGAYAIVAVKGNAISISGEDQEEVKGELMMGEGLQETALKEAVLDKGKASLDLSSSFRQERRPVNHGSARHGLFLSSWRRG